MRRSVERVSELKVVIGMNEGKVLCISNDERIIKSAMFDYLFETNQEFDVDFFELRNWGEYDIEIFNYEHQPTLNENQQIVLEYLKNQFGKYEIFEKNIFGPIIDLNQDPWNDRVNEACWKLNLKEQNQVLQAFASWVLEQEEE